MKQTLLACMLAAAGLTAMAVAPRQVQGIPHEKGGCSVQKAPKSRVEYVDWVNWDEIQNWAGDPNGEKKTALVIDFQDGKDERALVYGYRWMEKPRARILYAPLRHKAPLSP